MPQFANAIVVLLIAMIVLGEVLARRAEEVLRYLGLAAQDGPAGMLERLFDRRAGRIPTAPSSRPGRPSGPATWREIPFTARMLP